MKQLFGQPARGHLRPPKPSRVTLRGLAMNEGKDHRLVPTAKVEVIPGPALEAGLEIMLEPTVRVTLMVTYEACIPSPPNEPLPRRRVTFHDPKDREDPAKEEAGCSMEPSVGDLETWLEFQAGELGTPAWWEELGIILGIKDWHQFAQKIRASFYILEVWIKVSPEQGFTVPLAPWSLNRSTFLLEKLAYQDV